ncbi:MAG: DJ-1/PfpI family protein [Ignavibacteriota bacterium]
MKIQIIIFDGFDELDAIAPYEVLRAAAETGIDLHVDIVSLDGAEFATASHGLRVGVTGQFDEELDIALIPGGGWNSGSSQGVRKEIERGIIPAKLRELHTQGKTIASVCTGAMIIAAAGLLKNRNATTHHTALGDLSEYGAHIRNARVVDDGEIITAGGITSGLDLALWLIERYYGAELSATIEKRLEYQRQGEVWKNNPH